jgi:hypothetical protein
MLISMFYWYVYQYHVLYGFHYRLSIRYTVPYVIFTCPLLFYRTCVLDQCIYFFNFYQCILLLYAVPHLLCSYLIQVYCYFLYMLPMFYFVFANVYGLFDYYVTYVFIIWLPIMLLNSAFLFYLLLYLYYMIRSYLFIKFICYYFVRYWCYTFVSLLCAVPALIILN